DWRLIPEAYPYTQADVIRLMRERSIGRPSTYASILQKLFDRGYIYERKRWLLPTRLGRAVCRYLDAHYGRFISEERTRRLLEKMDSIERGEAEYIDILTELYNEVKTIK
ncbi:reverse gyrase, partial [Candidatus Bathyarchaeota archaeon]